MGDCRCCLGFITSTEIPGKSVFKKMVYWPREIEEYRDLKHKMPQHPHVLTLFNFCPFCGKEI